VAPVLDHLNAGSLSRLGTQQLGKEAAVTRVHMAERLAMLVDKLAHAPWQQIWACCGRGSVGLVALC
jgi:hypothetical protein